MFFNQRESGSTYRHASWASEIRGRTALTKQPWASESKSSSPSAGCMSGSQLLNFWPDFTPAKGGCEYPHAGIIDKSREARSWSRSSCYVNAAVLLWFLYSNLSDSHAQKTDKKLSLGPSPDKGLTLTHVGFSSVFWETSNQWQNASSPCTLQIKQMHFQRQGMRKAAKNFFFFSF